MSLGTLCLIENLKIQTQSRGMFVSLVRPHFEYAVHVWNPKLQDDKIERVQKALKEMIQKYKS